MAASRRRPDLAMLSYSQDHFWVNERPAGEHGGGDDLLCFLHRQCEGHD
jgi:hypothetical protein